MPATDAACRECGHSNIRCLRCGFACRGGPGKTTSKQPGRRPGSSIFTAPPLQICRTEAWHPFAATGASGGGACVETAGGINRWQHTSFLSNISDIAGSQTGRVSAWCQKSEPWKKIAAGCQTSHLAFTRPYRNSVLPELDSTTPSLTYMATKPPLWQHWCCTILGARGTGQGMQWNYSRSHVVHS